MEQHSRVAEYADANRALKEALAAARLELEALRHEKEIDQGIIRRQEEKLRSADVQINKSTSVIRRLTDEVHHLENTVEAFRSGTKFEKLRKSYETQANRLRRENKNLRSALAEADRTLRTMRENWIGVLEDYERQMERERKDHAVQTRHREMKLEAAHHRSERSREELRRMRGAQKRLEKELEEARDIVLRLERQVNMNYENSSLTSANCEITRKKIISSREKTGRLPGARSGHPGHGRKRLEGADRVYLEVPSEIKDSLHWMRTGRSRTHQVIGLRICPVTRDYVSEEYENIHTGKRYSPPFPKEARDDVNYDSSVRSFLLYLTHQCFTSIDNARRFLAEVTGGALQVSHGFTENLPRRFSSLTEPVRKEIYEKLERACCLHADFTVGWVDGSRVAIGVCSDGKGHVLYRMSRHKGYEAAALLPIQDVLTLVSDREAVLLNRCGIRHQVCLEHLRRDLNDVLQNDPDRQWAAMMKDLLQKLREESKTWGGRGLRKEERRVREQKYDQILALGDREYKKRPASRALPQGPTLLAALRKLKEHVLYFLRHPWIPPDNSEAERRIRVFKRKQHQCVTFRSEWGIIGVCDFLSVITTARLQGRNVFEELRSIWEGAQSSSSSKQAA